MADVWWKHAASVAVACSRLPISTAVHTTKVDVNQSQLQIFALVASSRIGDQRPASEDDRMGIALRMLHHFAQKGMTRGGYADNLGKSLHIIVAG